MRRLLLFLPLLLFAEANIYFTFDNFLYFPNYSSFWRPRQVFHIYSDFSPCWAANLDFSRSVGRFRLSLSPSLKVTKDELDFSWREAFLSFEAGNFEFSAGKRIVRWGTGYFRTPIGVITPRKAISDPEDRARLLQGVWMGKADYYGESFAISAALYRKGNERHFAIMGYKNIFGTDLYALVNFPEGSKPEVGGAFSSVFGESLEVHGEAMLKRKAEVLYHRSFKENPNQNFPEPLYTPEGPFLEALLGINCTWKGINLIAEYYHKDWGMENAWFENLRENFLYNLSVGNIQGCYLDIAAVSREGSFRDYLFLRLWKVLSPLDISLVGFVNLQDGSGVYVIEVLYRLEGGPSIFLRPALFYGKEGSEFGEAFYRFSLSFGFYGSM